MNKYRNQTQKTIKLPTGFEVTIHTINSFDAPFVERRVSDDDKEAGARLIRYVLLNKIGPIDGMTVVEKPTASAELGINELRQDDIDAIMEAVMEFSGISARALEARKTFRAPQQEANGDGSSVGPTILPAADGIADAAVG